VLLLSLVIVLCDQITKLLVKDLEKSAAFYKAVCGLVEQQRVDATINGRPIREIMFLPTYPGGGSLTLLHFRMRRSLTAS
jgi:catechol 2,3-dioxygenase-like lactoylglutathione lyase family enzyme